MTLENPGAETPLAEAIGWLRERIDDGATCPCCGQLAKVYRRKITSQTARALITMYRASAFWTDTNPHGWVHLPTLLRRTQADEAKARYWGLIEPMPDTTRDDGSTRTGWWRLTETGQLFVRGEIDIPKYVRIYDGKLLSTRVDDVDEIVSIRDCLGTRFNYDQLMAGI